MKENNEINDSDFNLWKKQALEKVDKSNIGSIDLKIRNLCDIINSKKKLFTLSSCSGRISILKREEIKKIENIWLFVSHDEVSSTEIYDILINNNISDVARILEFRVEGAIIHISVKSLDIARDIMEMGKRSGFNRRGIIALRNKIVVELITDTQLILPIYDEKLLISKEYLDYLVDYGNKLLRKSWESINKLENEVQKID